TGRGPGTARRSSRRPRRWCSRRPQPIPSPAGPVAAVSHADVVIVGSGRLRAATAFYLVTRGVRNVITIGPPSLDWHERRRALVLDQDHQFGRFRTAGVPVNDMNI